MPNLYVNRTSSAARPLQIAQARPKYLREFVKSLQAKSTFCKFPKGFKPDWPVLEKNTDKGSWCESKGGHTKTHKQFRWKLQRQEIDVVAAEI